jgi:hypothetical protein
VRVESVHLPECRAHLPGLDQPTSRQRRKRHEPFLEVDSLLAERQKKVGARIRVDDRLERHFRLRHVQRRFRPNLVRTRRPEEVADHGHVRIEDLRRCRHVAVQRQRSSGPAGTRSAGGNLHCWRLRSAWYGAGGRRGGTAKSRQLRFECRQPGVELPFEQVDLFAQRLRALRSRRRGRCRRRLRVNRWGRYQ